MTSKLSVESLLFRQTINEKEGGAFEYSEATIRENTRDLPQQNQDTRIASF